MYARVLYTVVRYCDVTSQVLVHVYVYMLMYMYISHVHVHVNNYGGCRKAQATSSDTGIHKSVHLCHYCTSQTVDGM